jgi:hypothetical protein
MRGYDELGKTEGVRGNRFQALRSAEYDSACGITLGGFDIKNMLYKSSISIGKIK